MPEFFKRLNFTFGNEDWNTEQEALSLKPTDRVLCVTGSGDRPLHLLMQDCKEIVSVDANQAQTHLLELKIAAMQALPYEDYVSFLGGSPSTDRLQHFSKVSASLSHESNKFWEKHHAHLSRGILYEGIVEKWMQLLAKIAKLCHGKKKIEKLFSYDNLEEQRHFVDHHWDQRLWRTVLRIGLQPRLSQLFWNDPGLYAHVDPNIKPGRHIHQKMKKSLTNHLACENFFMSFWLKGHVDKQAFPPYLTQQGVSLIKPRLDRITPATDNLLQYMESAPPNSFDCFSMSDIASYMDTSSFSRLMEGVYRTARPGARFCVRELMSRREIPEKLQPYFKRNTALETELEEKDRCFVYRFMVGTVAK